MELWRGGVERLSLIVLPMNDLEKIEARMHDIVQQDEAIERLSFGSVTNSKG